jgi:hypothetical protein
VTWYVAVAALICLVMGWIMEKLLGKSVFSRIVLVLGYGLFAIVLYSIVMEVAA